MSKRSLTRVLLVPVMAATLVVGSAVAANAVDENTFSGTVEQVESACDGMGGAYFESDDATYGVCIVEGGLSLGCDDIAIEGEDNCWVMQERRVPKEARLEFNELKDAVGGLESAGKPPKRVRVLVDALELVAQPGYCDKNLPRRTQMLLEALTVALLEGDRGLETCGSSDQSPPVPQSGSGGSTSTSTSSTTSPPDTTSTSSDDGQLT
jgi:hypothetical protein